MIKETNIGVDLIDYTGAGHADPLYAGRLLAFTKSTRLNMSPEGFQRFLDMPAEAIAEELHYMVSTLPSSWEFVNATFCVREVSRACAQQITRTRWSPMEADIFGSYAMQAQRVTDVSEAPMHVPAAVKAMEGTNENSDTWEEWYKAVLGVATDSYRLALEGGMHAEDARGLLPMHTASNLVVQFNLRALTELCRKRSSMRVQGEYNTVVALMREHICRVWPWSAPFFEPKESIASAIIEEVAKELPRELRLKLAKAADLIKVG